MKPTLKNKIKMKFHFWIHWTHTVYWLEHHIVCECGYGYEEPIYFRGNFNSKDWKRYSGKLVN